MQFAAVVAPTTKVVDGQYRAQDTLQACRTSRRGRHKKAYGTILRMNTAYSASVCIGGWRQVINRFALMAVGISFSMATAAADVKVLSAEDFVPVVAAMAPMFEKRTGDKLVVVNDTVAGVVKRIRDGQDFDLTILPPELLEALGKEEAVSVGSITLLAKVVAGAHSGTVYAGAVSAWAVDSHPALSLLILLASEDTQLVLKDKGMAPP